jgi:site-specific DNA recombinase
MRALLLSIYKLSLQQDGSKMSKIGLYVRVSTENQAGEDKYSLPQQREDGEKFALGLGLPYIIYEDHKSGADVSREGWQALMSAISSHEVDIVWCGKIDRFSRCSLDGETAIKNMQEAKTRFFISSVEYDIYDPITKYMLTMLFGQAEFERMLIKARTSGGKKRKRDAGYKMVIDIFGYNRVFDEHGKKVVIKNEEEAKCVKYIYDLFTDEGLTITEICKRLVADGYKGKYDGKVYKYKTGAEKRIESRWAYSTVKQILTHPEYAGLTYKSNKVDLIDSNVYREQIIPRTQWYKAQDIHKEKRSKYSHQTGYRIVSHFASGVLTCAKCGARYYFINYRGGKRSENSRNYYYYVHKRLLPIQVECKNKATMLDWKLVEDILDIVYYQVFSRPEELHQYMDQQSDFLKKTKEELEADTKRIKNEIDSIDVRLRRLAIAIEEGIAIESVKERYDDLNIQRKTAEDLLKKKKLDFQAKMSENRSILNSFTTNSLKEYSEAKGEKKRQMLKTIISEATIDDNCSESISAGKDTINKVLRIKTTIGGQILPINLSRLDKSWEKKIDEFRDGMYSPEWINSQRDKFDKYDEWLNDFFGLKIS